MKTKSEMLRVIGGPVRRREGVGTSAQLPWTVKEKVVVMKVRSRVIQIMFLRRLVIYSNYNVRR